jgi:hypothetical protein
MGYPFSTGCAVADVAISGLAVVGVVANNICWGCCQLAIVGNAVVGVITNNFHQQS